jgi:hypothetical protein
MGVISMFNSQRDEHYRDSRFLREEYYSEMRAEHNDPYDHDEPMTAEEEAEAAKHAAAWEEKVKRAEGITEDQLRRWLKLNNYEYQYDAAGSELWRRGQFSILHVPLAKLHPDNFAAIVHITIESYAVDYGDLEHEAAIERVFKDLAEIAEVCKKYNWPVLKSEDYGKEDGFSN